MGTPHFRWSRLSADLSPLMSRVYPPLDERVAPLLPAIHDFDKAHLLALLDAKILDRLEAARLLDTLTSLEPHVVAERLDRGGHIHSGEEYLTGELGEALAGKLHTGRSSGDVYVVATRITQREMYLGLAEALRQVLEACFALVDAHKTTLMPSYSHLQHAQVTTFSHYLAGWIAEGLRGMARIREAYARNNISPAGAAVGTGSPFPIDPTVAAGLLGFDGVYTNTREAIWSTDLVLEGLWTVTSVASTWARLVEDLQVWSSAEFAMVELAEPYCINSSILPQKRNPIALQHIRAMPGVAVGHLVTAVSIFKSVSDCLVIDREIAIEGMWKSSDTVTDALRLLAGTLRDLAVDDQQMGRSVRASWAYCSDLASSLVTREGLSWRQAQQTVSTLVSQMISAGRAPASVGLSDLDGAMRAYLGRGVSGLSADDLIRILDPAESVRTRQVPGGPAIDDVEAQIRSLRTSFDDEVTNLQVQNRSVEAARVRLAERVRDVTGDHR